MASEPEPNEILAIVDGWMEGYDFMGTGSLETEKQGRREWARDRAKIAAALLAAERRERDAERRQSQAASDVLAERQRQVEAEGWTAEHDDAHGNGELARAAGCYATHAGDCYDWGSPDYEQADPPFTDDELGVVPWPWDIEWWKPTNPRRDLVKAAALILAEIERLDRAAAIRKGA